MSVRFFEEVGFSVCLTACFLSARAEEAIELVKIPGENFSLGKYEVTQRQWREVMGLPSGARELNSHPMTFVSWVEANEFCKMLTMRESKAGRIGAHQQYKLPTSEQWRIACLAGESEIQDLDSFAWTPKNSSDSVHPVGTKQPNKWGLFDMLGNVEEWCDGEIDARAVDSHPPFTDGRLFSQALKTMGIYEKIVGMNKGKQCHAWRKTHGGGFRSAKDFFRLDFWLCYDEMFMGPNVGFRVALVELPKLSGTERVVISGIPQVEQKKNYCGPASVEMILKYHDAKNKNLKQNKLGSYFDSSSGKGTYVENLLQGFKHPRLAHFRISEEYNLFRDGKTFSELLRAYNESISSSKKTGGRKAKKIKTDDFGWKNLDKMDPDLGRKVFGNSRLVEKERFLISVVSELEANRPVLWSTIMRLDPNDPLSGGHFRLINGFETKNGQVKTIYYADPWGSVFVQKKMSADDAWAITWCYFFISVKE